MRLTKKKALKICIELWTYLAETGRSSKYKWPDWEKYGYMIESCALCEYATQLRASAHAPTCDYCMYQERFGHCNEIDDTPYYEWERANSVSARKTHASTFLEQLRQL